jgi:hypothetical protein
MADENEDVKSTEQDSSSSSDETTTESSTVDKEESSSDQTKPGLRDAIAKAFPTEDSKSEDKEDDETSEDEEDKEDEVVDTDKEEETEDKEEENKGPVPYDRFQEVIKEKNEVTEWRKQVEPMVQAYQNIHNYCTQAGITSQDFDFWLSVGALAKSDPQKALELLQPQLQQLQSVTGDVLPPDLQEAVKLGEITEAHARRLAKAEGQKNLVQKQSQQTQEQLRAQGQQQFANQLQNTLSTWITNKQTSDPDLKPASKDAPDGKLEFVMMKIAELWRNGAKVESPQDLVGLAEEALKKINASYARFKPKMNGQKHVRSSQSSKTVGTTEIKTLADAIRAGAQAAMPRR